jgi:hypothetical protein
LVGSAPRAALTIDFDFGEFILPISIRDFVLADKQKASVQGIAASMLGIIERAEKLQDKLARREIRMREALEASAAKLGSGVAPLWLRMEPVPVFEELRDLTRRRYNLLLVTLNECLMWSPISDVAVDSMTKIRGLYSSYSQQQRVRAARLAELEASGSEGWISEVALAMIEERGLNPRVVFEQARQSSLADRNGAIEFNRNGDREMLSYRDGALVAMFSFPGGAYSHGTLFLDGQYPETLASAGKGQPLSKFVDHPALCATGVKVRKAQSLLSALMLDHTVCMIPLEEVEPHVAVAA